MPKTTVYDMTGKSVGEMELSDEIFGQEVNANVLHEVVRAYLANQRQGTQSALTRAEVSGGGIKPWRQKGTGRARQGSTRSPQWTGGGVVFAPVPRDYNFKMNKKEKRAALRSALSDKVANSNLIVLEDLTLEEVKTKKFAEILKNLKVEKKALVVTEGNDDKVRLSARNLPQVRTAFITSDGANKSSSTINVYDIMNANTLILTKDAVAKIEEVYA